MKKQNSKTLCVFMSILFAAACFLFATAELTDSGYYKISANRLPSALVEGNGERVVQNEQAGYLTYGPYTHLPRGKYTVTVTYSCTGSGNFVDIASQTGAVIHKKQDLTVNSTECHINFSVADAVDDLEIRTFYGGNGELSVESIQITALPNQLKPAVLLFAGVFFLIEPARYLWKELLVIMGKGRIRKGVVIGCSIFLFSMLFGVSIHNSLTNGSKRVLFAVSIVCGLLCESAYRNKHMEKYFSLSSMIAILAVSLYASLATFFYRFFLAEERMVFSVRGCA